VRRNNKRITVKQQLILKQTLDLIAMAKSVQKDLSTIFS